jgi:uncharacterized caspase-like protein
MMLRALAVLLTMLLASEARAERRVALVIGNGGYVKVTKLPNATSDADAVGALFLSAGFDVVEIKHDLGGASLRSALRAFSDQTRDADIAVVYYAGHGIEVDGANYLIPVDSTLERDIDVEDEAIPLDRVIRILEQAKRLRLVILDACRDNPFTRSMKRTLAGRSIGRGLAKVDDLTSDTLIAFAAKAGSTAADGTGANSPYTTALVKHLITPGLDLRLALGRVRDDVLKSSGNKQEPFVYGSLGGAEIALVPAANSETKAGNAPQSTPRQRMAPSDGAQAWAAAKDATNIAALEAFIARYPDTYYADLARLRIEELQKSQIAAATPPLARTTAPPKVDPPQPALAASAQEASCRYHKVGSSLLNVSKDAGGHIYIDVLENGDIACVTRQLKVEGADWGYISHKLDKPNGTRAVDGWSMLVSMTELSPVDVATLRTAAPPVATAVAPGDVLRFDQPVPFGPFPVNGRSIKELIETTPLFPPIVGLDEALWKKPCSTCHQWTKDRLCDQGKTYVKAPQNALRHQHPMGGALKIALMNWAKSGCN